MNRINYDHYRITEKWNQEHKAAKARANKIILAGLLIVVAVLYFGVANAGTVCQQYGNQTYCQHDNGSSSTGQKYGNTQYWTDSNGNSTVCQKYGNQTYCN